MTEIWERDAETPDEYHYVEAIRGREAMSPLEFLSSVRDLGVETEADSEEIVRSARDAR